ncbi:MAG: prepilin-type N-terminal cleavage/methylation domain-containing protein [Dehalococcoidales bacterium]|nr:prepilin-type N-terminal cleavage/methylation domain-containing protein [Dehalococcoidales bacterium]
MKGLIKRIGGFDLSFTRRLHRGQKGFTLMELLIVVAILGVLAAVVIPRFTGLIGRGQTEAATTELSIVQTAMVAAMTDAKTATVSPQATYIQLTPSTALIGNYLQTDTNWTYIWDDNGTVTQGAEYTPSP